MTIVHRRLQRASSPRNIPGLGAQPAELQRRPRRVLTVAGVDEPLPRRPGFLGCAHARKLSGPLELHVRRPHAQLGGALGHISPNALRNASGKEEVLTNPANGPSGSRIRALSPGSSGTSGPASIALSSSRMSSADHLVKGSVSACVPAARANSADTSRNLDAIPRAGRLR